MARDSEYRRVYNKRKSGIHIKASHEGRLHEAARVSKDKKIPLSEEEHLKSSGTPAERKEATFAINARSWHHG